MSDIIMEFSGPPGPGLTVEQQAQLDAATAPATPATSGQMSSADKGKLDSVAAGATVNAPDAVLRDRGTHTGTQSADTLTDGIDKVAMTMAERTKLDGVAAGATANDSDDNLKSRANHTGEQAISTVTGLGSALDSIKATAAQTQGRPGDAGNRFTATLTGDAGGALPAPGEAAVSDDAGSVQRVTGAAIVALRERVALDPLRKYRVRLSAIRAIDPTDPAGDTIRFGIQWLNKNKAQVSQRILADVTASIATGRIIQEAVVAVEEADGVDYVWPATARYMVPFVQSYGADGVTDIAWIAWEDVTDLADGQAAIAAEAASRELAITAASALVRSEFAAADALEAQDRIDGDALVRSEFAAADANLDQRIDDVYVRAFPDDRDGAIGYGVLVGENGRGFVADPETGQPLVRAVTAAVSDDRDGGVHIVWLGGRNSRLGAAFNILSNAMMLPPIERSAPADRDQDAAQASILGDRAGRSALAWDDLAGGLRAPTLLRRPSGNRDGGVLHPVIGTPTRAALAYNEYEGALDTPRLMRRPAMARDAGNHVWPLVGDRSGRSPIVWDEIEDAIDLRMSRAARARVEYHAPSEFLGPHRAFNVRVGKNFRYATVQEANGYVGDVRQRLLGGSTMAIADSADNIVELLTIQGQSNAGPNSALSRLFEGTPAPRHLIRTEFAYSYGDDMIPAPSTPGVFSPMVEPPYSGVFGQTPAAIIATSAFDLDCRNTALRVPACAVATNWRGSDPLDNFFPGAAGRHNHENLLEHCRRARVAARLDGCTVRHDMVFIQGEAGAVGDYYATLNSYLDTVVPIYGGNKGSGDAALKLFLLQTNSTSAGSAYDAAALAQLRVARERFAAGVTTLASPMYDGPLENEGGADIHGNALARMIIHERTALAREFVRRKATPFHPTWPVAGGMTASDNVVTVPISLATGALALAIDTDRVAAVPNYGFVWNRLGGGGPDVTGVAISGTNIIITLSAAPASGDTLRYALDNVAPLEGWAGGRGQIYATTNVPSPWAARGFNVPPTIRQPLVRFEEILP